MKRTLRKSFWFNLLLILLICVALYYIFFASLGVITRHGNEVKVPAMVGRDMKMAMKELEKMDFEVDIDSAYDPKKKPYAVLSQIPDVGSVVKRGRTIFLTINKAEPPLTPMPNLLNLSYRSAEMLLKSNKLKLGDTSYRPDIAEGAILAQMYKGKEIRPGELVPQGSRIDLVIGHGLSNVQMSVPDVIGMSYAEAVNFLSAYGLQYTAVWDGSISDSNMAVVYYQEPNALNELGTLNRIKAGDLVDIRLKENPSQNEMERNRNPNAPVNDNDDEESSSSGRGSGSSGSGSNTQGTMGPPKYEYTAPGSQTSGRTNRTNQTNTTNQNRTNQTNNRTNQTNTTNRNTNQRNTDTRNSDRNTNRSNTNDEDASRNDEW